MANSDKHSETRKVLWQRRQVELITAQQLDAEREGLQERCQALLEEANRSRDRAFHLRLAAEALGELDAKPTRTDLETGNG